VSHDERKAQRAVELKGRLEDLASRIARLPQDGPTGVDGAPQEDTRDAAADGLRELAEVLDIDLDLGAPVVRVDPLAHQDPIAPMASSLAAAVVADEEERSTAAMAAAAPTAPAESLAEVSDVGSEDWESIGVGTLSGALQRQQQEGTGEEDDDGNDAAATERRCAERRRGTADYSDGSEEDLEMEARLDVLEARRRASKIRRENRLMMEEVSIAGEAKMEQALENFRKAQNELAGEGGKEGGGVEAKEGFFQDASVTSAGSAVSTAPGSIDGVSEEEGAGYVSEEDAMPAAATRFPGSNMAYATSSAAVAAASASGAGGISAMAAAVRDGVSRIDALPPPKSSTSAIGTGTSGTTSTASSAGVGPSALPTQMGGAGLGASRGSLNSSMGWESKWRNDRNDDGEGDGVGGYGFAGYADPDVGGMPGGLDEERAFLERMLSGPDDGIDGLGLGSQQGVSIVELYARQLHGRQQEQEEAERRAAQEMQRRDEEDARRRAEREEERRRAPPPSAVKGVSNANSATSADDYADYSLDAFEADSTGARTPSNSVGAVSAAGRGGGGAAPVLNKDDTQYSFSFEPDDAQSDVSRSQSVRFSGGLTGEGVRRGASGDANASAMTLAASASASPESKTGGGSWMDQLIEIPASDNLPQIDVETPKFARGGMLGMDEDGDDSRVYRGSEEDASYGGGVDDTGRLLPEDGEDMDMGGGMDGGMGGGMGAVPRSAAAPTEGGDAHDTRLSPEELRGALLSQIELLHQANVTEQHLQALEHSRQVSAAQQETMHVAEYYRARQVEAQHEAEIAAVEEAHAVGVEMEARRMQEEMATHYQQQAAMFEVQEENVRAAMRACNQRDSSAQTQAVDTGMGGLSSTPGSTYVHGTGAGTGVGAGRHGGHIDMKRTESASSGVSMDASMAGTEYSNDFENDETQSHAGTSAIHSVSFSADRGSTGMVSIGGRGNSGAGVGVGAGVAHHSIAESLPAGEVGDMSIATSVGAGDIDSEYSVDAKDVTSRLDMAVETSVGSVAEVSSDMGGGGRRNGGSGGGEGDAYSDNFESFAESRGGGRSRRSRGRGGDDTARTPMGGGSGGRSGGTTSSSGGGEDTYGTTTTGTDGEDTGGMGGMGDDLLDTSGGIDTSGDSTSLYGVRSRSHSGGRGDGGGSGGRGGGGIPERLTRKHMRNLTKRQRHEEAILRLKESALKDKTTQQLQWLVRQRNALRDKLNDRSEAGGGGGRGGRRGRRDWGWRKGGGKRRWGRRGGGGARRAQR
jgi:hypothetical protein